MRQPSPTWWLLLGLLCCAACSTSSKPKDVADAPARRKLLEHLSERVFVPSFTAFATEARTLEARTAAYAKTLSETDRDAAREAFVAAMLAWERAELFQVGPLGVFTTRNTAGKGLRNEIYKWPGLSRCGIEQALVSESYADAATLATNIVANARGLWVIEILLYDQWTETSCLTSDPVVTAAAWTKLVSGADFAKRRAAYAAALASYVKKQADAVVSAFKNGYAKELATAGAGSKIFDTSQDALNVVSDALFYLDVDTKDMKLANPAGISDKCTKTCAAGDTSCVATCPDLTEHPYAKISKEAIIANLEAFRDAFRGLPPDGQKGTELWGFLDLLRSVSATTLATEMDALIDESLAATSKIDGPLEDALADPDKNKQVLAAYAEIQSLTDRLKNQFLDVLNLAVPMTAAADND